MAGGRSGAAIVGTGNIAGAHVEALRRMGGRAGGGRCCGRGWCAGRGVLYGAWNSKSYEDTEEMLEEEAPDLVHICTPPQSHRELSVMCMEAGAWVLCEKPLVCVAGGDGRHRGR